MIGASLSIRRHKSDFPMFLEPVLAALLAPLKAAGAAVIALNGGAGKPVNICTTGNGPLALLGATELLLAGSHGPSHGICTDLHPVLAGPWQMPLGQQVILVFWRRIDAKPWKQQDHHLLLTIAAALSAFVKNGGSSPKESPSRSAIDIVTGLPKARKFVADLPRHFARLDREGLPGTMILVSIDEFSRLNSHLGRKGIEEVVRQTAEILNRMSRPTDVVARISDDEFAVWLNGADQFTAAERAEQLRADAPRILAFASRGIPVSLSVGIAPRRPGSPETVHILMQRADVAMHEAKKAGAGLWRVSQEHVG
jgi:diguanylate cyclase (GGDEF)-like protein